jgi:hypothetical protein
LVRVSIQGCLHGCRWLTEFEGYCYRSMCVSVDSVLSEGLTRIYNSNAPFVPLKNHFVRRSV